EHLVATFSFRYSAMAPTTAYAIYDDGTIMDASARARFVEHRVAQRLPGDLLERLRARPCGCEYAWQSHGGRGAGLSVDSSGKHEEGSPRCSPTQTLCVQKLLHRLGVWIEAQGESWPSEI